MAPLSEALGDRARRVRLLLLDVDGVLTDGRFLVTPDGGEIKTFHARDGLGIRLAIDAGIRVGFLSGRRSEAVARRAVELGLDEICLGVKDKLAVLTEILDRQGLAADETAYFGDDLVDLPVMRRAGLAVTVPEADSVVRDAAHIITTRAGGHGAVRELVEAILVAQGRWERAIARFTEL